jgi:predicted negative regulator of RcsB-dependent stress response
MQDISDQLSKLPVKANEQVDRLIEKWRATTHALKVRTYILAAVVAMLVVVVVFAYRSVQKERASKREVICKQYGKLHEKNTDESGKFLDKNRSFLGQGSCAVLVDGKKPEWVYSKHGISEN